jgi:hypothetical protein
MDCPHGLPAWIARIHCPHSSQKYGRMIAASRFLGHFFLIPVSSNAFNPITKPQFVNK